MEVEVLNPEPTYVGFLWDGWSYHTVTPIIKGKRYVLIIHYTGIMKG